ncbi:MAG: hypothetical protein H6834_01155 [Planctomycetes bacterium]|nr:hypothetical protein [Planctomycetota bacterium]
MARFAKLLAFGAILAVTATTTYAQKTWVVDASRGPGYDHAEIAPAIAAASEGDAIVVRPGSYAIPRSVVKAVRILGEPGAILDLGALANPFSVSAIGAGKTFVLAGFRIQASYAQAGYFRVADCLGTVSFEDLTCFAILFNIQSIQVERCNAAFFTRCNITGGLLARDSNITVDSSTISPYGGSATIACERSNATFTASTATGTDGFFRPAGVALESTASTIRLLAGTGSTYSPGISTQLTAIRGDAGSTLVLDPLVKLLPTGNANPHEGFGSVTTRNVPVLGVVGSTIGGLHRFTLHAQANDVFALFFGLPTHLHAPPFGDLWLEPTTLFHVTSGSVLGNLAVFTIPATKDVSLRGLPATWQVLNLHRTTIDLTNPAITTMR